MSSRRAQRRRGCGRKRRFDSAAEAQAAAVSRRYSARANTGYLVVYACRFCGGFHFGHPPRTPR